MEEKQLLKELKYDKMVLNCLKPMKLITASSSILFDAKIVRDVYEQNYLLHIDYLNHADSHIYLYLLCISLFGYVSARILEEYLQDDVVSISDNINKVKNKTLYN